LGEVLKSPELAPEAFFIAPPLSGGLDLDSRSSGCARLGGGVGPPLGVVVEEVVFIHQTMTKITFLELD